MQICVFISLAKPIDDFESFLNNFELTIDTVTVALGDFNAKSNLWFKGNQATYECSKIDGIITSSFRLQQIINELAHYGGFFLLH